MEKMFHKNSHLYKFLIILLFVQLVIPSALAQPEKVIDLKKVESFIVSLQRPDGYFAYSQEDKSGNEWPTLCSLEILLTISTDLEKAIDTNTLWRNLEWHWGYIINGTWYPSAGVQARNIISYSLLGTRPPNTEKDYFVNLAKESQNSDGGIGWYKGGASTLWSTYFTIRALKILNSSNGVNIQAVLNYTILRLMGYSTLGPKDTYYAIAILDLLNRKIELKKENEIYNWLKEQLDYSDVENTYYVLASMKILDDKVECDEAKVLDLLKKYYDPNTGGFGWLDENNMLHFDIEYTWAAIKLFELLPNVKIDNYKLKFYVGVISSYSTISGSGWYEDGSSATLSLYQTTVYESNSVRYTFAGWYVNNFLLSLSPTITITVTKPTFLTTMWKKQYYVKVVSDRNNVEGEGWYEEGASATINVLSNIISGSTGERSVFSGWSGDISSTNTTVTFTVDRPKTIYANWKRQYYVNVYSDFSSFENGNDWCDEGSYVKLKLKETSLGFLVQKVFDHFEGLSSRDRVISNGEVEVFVDSPKTITAVWRTDYAQLLLFVFLAIIVGIMFIALAGGKKIVKVEKREVGTEVISTNIEELKEELKKYESYLSKLEKSKEEDTISENAYEKLKKEYQENIEKIKKEIEKSKSNV